MVNKNKIEVEKLNLYYNNFQALKEIEMKIPERRITAIIGPSGCGKSTLLRAFNRMNDLIEEARTTGRVLIDGQDIYGPDIDVVQLRKRVGMVFQRPNPFPMSIYENIAYGPQIHGINQKDQIEEIVSRSLKATALWDEVKDKLKVSALELSLGQQQRLCIARLLAIQPEVILLDEPCSALDPASTLQIEELMRELATEYTIVIVTHNMKQAARASHFTAFLLLGELVEYGPTTQIFTNPQRKETEDYVTGRFG